MRTVARIATRHVDHQPGQTDLFLGVMMKQASDVLKPDWVYELKEVLGELILVPVGPSAHPHAWNHSVNEVLESHRADVFCTESERVL